MQLGGLITTGSDAAYYAKEAQLNAAGQYRQPTLRENLVRQKAEIETRLANINEALAALDENPNFETILNTIQKAY